MVSYIVLNKRKIDVERYREEDVQGLKQIVADFKVTSEDYHDIATLLYQKKFDVEVPEQGLAFKGAIREYSTSITNLYEKGRVGDYHLALLEVKEGENKA
ncbi:YkvR family protein [Heyndrickxia coagulans]|uniref:YkvR family protein n=1 Tax=Heyndrickxia coagulans TaxID=1398 RepID=UPI002E1E17E3|nr:YkvR family protein [Heyndrickxia coagulans]